MVLTAGSAHGAAAILSEGLQQAHVPPAEVSIVILSHDAGPMFDISERLGPLQGWFDDHVRPLRAVLDLFAGDASAVHKRAQELERLAAIVTGDSDEVAQCAASVAGAWPGGAGEVAIDLIASYQEVNDEVARVFRRLGVLVLETAASAAKARVEIYRIVAEALSRVSRSALDAVAAGFTSGAMLAFVAWAARFIAGVIRRVGRIAEAAIDAVTVLLEEQAGLSSALDRASVALVSGQTSA